MIMYTVKNNSCVYFCASKVIAKVFHLDKFPNYSIVSLGQQYACEHEPVHLLLKINWMLSPCIYTYIATDLSPDLLDSY